jgi:hypothetical protein
MRFQTLGKAKQFGSSLIQNKDTVAIPVNSPVYYDITDADKVGVSAVSAESLAAADNAFFAGIAMTAIPVGGFGNVFCFGLYENARLFRRSRSATDVTWVSAISHAVGTALDAYTATGGNAGFKFNTSAIDINKVVVAQSVATLATAASNVTWAGGAATDTISYSSVMAFVRGL